jgi:hypothetical protein
MARLAHRPTLAPLLCPSDCEHCASYAVMAERDELLAADEIAAAREIHDEELAAAAYEPEHVRLGWRSEWSNRP